MWWKESKGVGRHLRRGARLAPPAEMYRRGGGIDTELDFDLSDRGGRVGRGGSH